MDNAIKQLSKVRRELNEIAVANADDVWTQNQVEDMGSKVGLIWVEAVLLPIHRDDSVMESLGYSFSAPGLTTTNFRRNQNASGLLSDISNFKTERWKQFSEAVQSEIDHIRSAISLFIDPQYSGGFSYNEKDRVENILFKDRLAVLEKTKELSTKTINCIDYFNSAADQYGLRLLIDGDRVSWASEDLQRVHGEQMVGVLSQSEKSKVKTQIDEMIHKANRFDYACTSIAVRSFLVGERASLAKE